MLRVSYEFTLEFFLFFNGIIFLLGVFGLTGPVKKNLVSVIISLELLFLAVNSNFAVTSMYLDDITGSVFSVFILVLAGAEVAVGLALLVSIFKLLDSVYIENIQNLKG